MPGHKTEGILGLPPAHHPSHIPPLGYGGVSGASMAWAWVGLICLVLAVGAKIWMRRGRSSALGGQETFRTLAQAIVTSRRQELPCES